MWLAFACWVGFFPEGIDLKEDSLIGALIVGTGLPAGLHGTGDYSGIFRRKRRKWF